jgi:hypothetical protein
MPAASAQVWATTPSRSITTTPTPPRFTAADISSTATRPPRSAGDRGRGAYPPATPGVSSHLAAPLQHTSLPLVNGISRERKESVEERARPAPVDTPDRFFTAPSSVRRHTLRHEQQPCAGRGTGRTVRAHRGIDHALGTSSSSTSHENTPLAEYAGNDLTTTGGGFAISIANDDPAAVHCGRVV